MESLNLTRESMDVALGRATLYSALALGFRPPTQETLRRISTRPDTQALVEAARILDDDSASPLLASVEILSAARPTLESLETSYARLFGHTARGVVSPYETEYGSEAIFQQSHELGDLSGFYLAFGLVLKSDEHERPDHISCECEFLSFLALKEAYSLETRDLPMLEEVRKATHLFLQNHLARFVPAFARKLGGENPPPFYGALGNVCLSLTSLECRQLDIPMGLEGLGLRPVMDDRVPMACGNAADCIPLPGAYDPSSMEDA